MKTFLHYSISRIVLRNASVALVVLAGFVPIARATNKFVNTAQENSSGFLNRWFGPFTPCTTLPVNAAVVATLNGQSCVKFAWHAANYDGTRVARGTEMCGSSNFAVQKEGWFGFYIDLPDPGYPMNKEAGIGQWFANNSACNSWTGMLSIRNNDLYIAHRGNCGTPTEAVVYANFPRNRWVSIVAHFVASHLRQGKFEIFIDGVSKYSAAGINFGFDTWDSSDSLIPPNHIGIKFGQYDYDAAHFDANEVRTSYYTNVTEIGGNPSNVFDYIRNPIAGVFTDPSEGATVGGATEIETTNAGYNGTSYANLTTTGGTLTFSNVNGGSGDAKALEIRNALGVAGRTGELVVNGGSAGISYPRTEGWSTWETKNVLITLNAGTANTIQFQSNGQDLANIDEITVR